MVTIELNYEESLQYFDNDQVTLGWFEENDQLITEVRIEDNHVMYRVGTETDIGTATWEDDDYEGATDKLALMGKREVPSHTITATGYESVEKVAKRNGNSAAVTVPVSWLGHRVLCIRLD